MNNYCDKDTDEKDIRQELIDYLYEFNVHADIKIESMADDILTIVKK